jgi:hypothetical protein
MREAIREADEREALSGDLTGGRERPLAKEEQVVFPSSEPERVLRKSCSQLVAIDAAVPVAVDRPKSCVPLGAIDVAVAVAVDGRKEVYGRSLLLDTALKMRVGAAQNGAARVAQRRVLQR